MKTILFCLTLATCRLYAQTQDTLILRHLPPDADAIYRFNLPVITSKLGWQEWADRIPLPQQNTSARELAAILKQPFRAGVDPNKDIFWTELTIPGSQPSITPDSPAGPNSGTNPQITPDSPAGPNSGINPQVTPGSPAGPNSGINPQVTSGSPAGALHSCSLILHLADSNRFAAFIRDLEPGIRISSQDGQSSAGRNGMAASWDRSLLVITFITPIHPARSYSHHTTLAIRQSLIMLRGYTDTDRNSDPLFIHGFTDDADIDAWTAPGKISLLLLQYLLRPDHPLTYPQLTSPGSEKIRVLSTLRFEKGQVTIKSITPLPIGTANAWARLIARPSVPAALSLANSPAFPLGPDHITAFLDFHINPGAIGDLLDSLYARGRVEELLFDKGLSLENFVHAFQGDMRLTVTAPDSIHALPDHSAVAYEIDRVPERPLPDGILTSSPTRTTTGHPALYATIPLGDPTAFWQWMGQLKWLTVSPDQQDCGRGNARTTIGRHIPAWLVKDNCLIIAPDHQHALNWSNDSAGCKPPVSATPAIDAAHRPIDAAHGPIDAAPALPAMDAPLSLRIDLKNRTVLRGHPLDQLLFTAGRLNAGNQIENVLQLTLADSSRNSLPILFRLLE